MSRRIKKRRLFALPVNVHEMRADLSQKRLRDHLIIDKNTILARGGKLVNIEGPGPVYSEVKRLSVVEFENMEKAQATFASPSYSDVRTIGNKHAKFRIIGVEGVPQ